MPPPTQLPPVQLTPIGIARTPHPDRVSAPRQPYAAQGTPGTIELFPGNHYEHALCDLEGWERIWVVFLFHLNPPGVFRPKVLPPRSAGQRRGVFATRSPHRPNPIGLSVLRLQAVDGLVLHVLDLDLVDGTPVLDIKPYVPWADAFPSSRTGWLAPLAPLPSTTALPEDAPDPTGLTSSSTAPPALLHPTSLDPEPGFQVTWAPLASEQAAWLQREHGVDLITPVDRALSLGPQPHPYRRIKRDGDAFRLAVKDWRIRFRVEGRQVTVERLQSGYRPAQLTTSTEPAIVLQAAFVERFPG